MIRNVVLLTDTIIGSNDDPELGEKLILSFIYSLCNSPDDDLPSHIILYSKAAKLVTINDQLCTHFLELQHRKVSILVCGTCLDYYDIKKLLFGKVSNMLEIVSILNNSTKVIKP